MNPQFWSKSRNILTKIGISILIDKYSHGNKSLLNCALQNEQKPITGNTVLGYVEKIMTVCD